MFVDSKRIALKMKVSDYFDPMENSVLSSLFLIIIQLSPVSLHMFRWSEWPWIISQGYK